MSLRGFNPTKKHLWPCGNGCHPSQEGKGVFSRLVGRTAPYTGTIKARVENLEPGFARCRLKDRRGIRNHLRSIHAIALANFIEETTGLAMVSAVPQGMRGIVVHIEIDYMKKARGELEAECQAPQVTPGESNDYIVETQVKNSAGDVVASGRVHWRIGPRNS